MPEHASLPVAARWIGAADELRSQFQRAEPFPHVVLDEFLDDDLANSLSMSFPSLDEMPRSRDFVFADKRERSSIETSGPAGARYHAAMTSPEMAAFLSAIADDDLFVDPSFHGGGFHQGGDGSYLDLHVDFNVHPLHDDWFRVLNVLLYLNRDWREDYGGHLLIKARPDDEPLAIAPSFNRCVIALTDGHTYHGYRRMSLPQGVTRKSIATYAYRRIEPGSVPARTTAWSPERANPVKRVVAHNYNWLVQRKNRWFGSGTARNR